MSVCGAIILRKEIKKMNDANKVVISFDLDFTLIDNKEGIINSFIYALKKFNLIEIDVIEIEKMIGTPLDEMFAKVTDLNPLLLSSAFREYYGEKGIYQVKLFLGIKKKLGEIKKAGFTLGVITSKKEEMAIKLLKYLELENYFEFILGETKERKQGKTDPKLKELLFNKFPNYKFVIIGDHPNDKKLAEFFNCPFIGVLTGFHSKEQLKQSSSVKTLILNNVNEITEEMIYSLF
ncbi:hypothetical protein ES705_14468 [subsurface metagenome]